MRTFDVKLIAKKLKAKFHTPDRPASRFTNKKLWSDCQSVFTDRNCTEKIIFANDLGVPPVKALIRILIDDFNYTPDTVFSAEEARNLGALVTFVFRDILKYDSVHTRRTVNLSGVKESCTFTKKDTGIPEQPGAPEQPENFVTDNTSEFGHWS